MEGGGTHLFVYRHITRLGAREESILFVKEKIAANRYLQIRAALYILSPD